MSRKYNFILAEKLSVVWLIWILGATAFSISCSLGLLPKAAVKLLPFTLVPLFALPAILGYITGRAPAKFGEIERSRNPIMFWMVISFLSLCALGLLAMGFVFLNRVE